MRDTVYFTLPNGDPFNSMYGLIRPFREDTPYYRNVEQILKSNGMKHLKINKNLYICIVNLMLTNC